MQGSCVFEDQTNTLESLLCFLKCLCSMVGPFAFLGEVAEVSECLFHERFDWASTVKISEELQFGV